MVVFIGKRNLYNAQIYKRAQNMKNTKLCVILLSTTVQNKHNFKLVKHLVKYKWYFQISQTHCVIKTYATP